MYTLVRAIGKKKEEGAEWTEVSLGGVDCATIAKSYSAVWFVLSSPYLNKLQSISLETIRNELVVHAGQTFNQWLISLGSSTLDTIPG